MLRKNSFEALRRFARDFRSSATSFGKPNGYSLFAAFDFLARLARFKCALFHFMDGSFHFLRSFGPVFFAA